MIYTLNPILKLKLNNRNVAHTTRAALRHWRARTCESGTGGVAEGVLAGTFGAEQHQEALRPALSLLLLDIAPV